MYYQPLSGVAIASTERCNHQPWLGRLARASLWHSPHGFDMPKQHKAKPLELVPVGQRCSIQLPLHPGGRAYKHSSCDSSEASGAGDAAAVLHLRMRLLDVEQCGLDHEEEDVRASEGGNAEAPTLPRATGDDSGSSQGKSRSCSVS